MEQRHCLFLDVARQNGVVKPGLLMVFNNPIKLSLPLAKCKVNPDQVDMKLINEANYG